MSRQIPMSEDMKPKKTYTLQVRTLPSALKVLQVMAAKRGYRSVSALVRAELNRMVEDAINSGEVTALEVFGDLTKDNDEPTR